MSFEDKYGPNINYSMISKAKPPSENCAENVEDDGRPTRS